MGGDYPSGHEFNFWGDNPFHAAHVINNWPGRITFSGYSMGRDVTSGGRLMREGPGKDPVRSAYIWYTYNAPRSSWDPLTVLYAINGLGGLFEFGNKFGYNHVSPNGSNSWVFDANRTDQHWLKLNAGRLSMGDFLDSLFLEGALSVSNHSKIEHMEL